MKTIHALLLAFSLLFSATAFSDDAPPKDPEAYKVWARGIWQSMEHKQGDVKLPNGVATLKVPEEFFYLSPDDAQRVLVDLWGNPPGEKNLGMLLPAGITPFDHDAWAVTIAYEEDGHVSDDDAAKINYSDLLQEMQNDTKDGSEEREKNGFPPIALIGWAAQPHYDQASHKLYWAKELQFGTDSEHTLNYNIRMLGREGVLVLNFIADMSQQRVIEANLDKVLAIANFDEGHRYSEYKPDVDKLAAYGIGGLIAGKVIAKTGLFIGALLFLKKFAVLGIAAAIGLFRKLAGRKSQP